MAFVKPLQGFIKQFQWQFGTTMACHGAIGLWRRDVLGKKVRWCSQGGCFLLFLQFDHGPLSLSPLRLRHGFVLLTSFLSPACLPCSLQILWDHDTVFHGEDLYMGLLLHRMRKNYAIMVSYRSSVSFMFFCSLVYAIICRDPLFLSIPTGLRWSCRAHVRPRKHAHSFPTARHVVGPLRAGATLVVFRLCFVWLCALTSPFAAPSASS